MIWQDKECLHLILKKKWFLEILCGSKTIEYRDDTPFWEKRLANKDIKYIYFQYGYFSPATYMVVECISKEKKNGYWELGLGRKLHFENNHHII